MDVADATGERRWKASGSSFHDCHAPCFSERNVMKEGKIRSLVLGPLATNCYLFWHRETKQALIVDPADKAGRIAQEVERLGIDPVAVLLTHGHFDHVMAAKQICQAYQIPSYAYEAEAALLADPNDNLSYGFAGISYSMQADHWVKDREHLKLAGFDIEVLATPGHTIGSCCYYIAQEQVLLSGDTLFCESVGRTDFPTSSTRSLIASIRDRLFVLPDETQVYPGHNEPTTIGFEKQYNPVVPYCENSR